MWGKVGRCKGGCGVRGGGEGCGLGGGGCGVGKEGKEGVE